MRVRVECMFHMEACIWMQMSAYGRHRNCACSHIGGKGIDHAVYCTWEAMELQLKHPKLVYSIC